MASQSDQKIVELQATIKSLTRDNKVLQRKIEKLESTSGKKQKKMDNEREMRLAANKEKYELGQKLDKLQKAIAARLKRLGVDFSKISDISTALDMSFNVIQKLAKELQQKEEQLNELKNQKQSLIDNEMTTKQIMKQFTQKMETLQKCIKTLENEQNNNLSKIDELNVKNDMLTQENVELFDQKTEIEMKLNQTIERLNNLQSENELKYQNKCDESDIKYNVLHDKYKKLKREMKENSVNMKSKQNENETKIKSLKDTLKTMKTRKENEKQIEIKYKNQMTNLHAEVMEKDKIIATKKKKIGALKKELDIAGFGDNKKFSHMSLLKENVKNMNNIIRDKDNQIKMLNNKLKAIQKEK